ncbi:hypothetical protein O1611_g4343 [Lasiodiplodia mahajangana]|uniref:Uncharacterized protein n=1 Tax=Lasiodiplodia mahajangana TaxID=1108764 RepID=A0ACC2JP47_9PEZI|nr:hypothetical protein O1611_g4343 [Lasiodiplodia mahajangana]
MPRTLELAGREPITISSALTSENNIIKLASYTIANDKFYQELWAQRKSIEAIIRHHLALGAEDIVAVLPSKRWIRGGFNVCIPVAVKTRAAMKSGKPPTIVIFRCPMPYKLAEARYPGSIDEKLSGEVGAYIWIEENCPEIRSPHLFGFGMTDGRHVSPPSWARRAPAKTYHPPSERFYPAYMILENLGPETGQMLSNTFSKCREDKERRQRLFRGMSRVMISLARIPQAQIGSFQFNHDGTVTLSGRPLTCGVMILENNGAPRTMARNETIRCTDAFVSEMLDFHDQRFLREPNAALNESDCYTQMAVKTLLRVFSHNHIKKELRNGPFLIQHTDFHASNILVDEDWNITGLIDLEWMCALPAEMLAVPYWLTGCSVDGIRGDEYDRFDEVRREFLHILEEEEEQVTKAKAGHNINLSQIMHEMWDSKGVWFYECLLSVNAMYLLLDFHLVPPKGLTDEVEKILSRFWCGNSEDVVQMKLADKKAYDEELRQLFHE